MIEVGALAAHRNGLAGADAALPCGCLHLPGEPNARLSASTSNGSVSTDFEMRMRGEFSKHHLEGAIGNGGPLMDLSSSNGSIRVLR